MKMGLFELDNLLVQMQLIAKYFQVIVYTIKSVVVKHVPGHRLYQIKSVVVKLIF